MMPQDITIIIVTYNSEKIIGACLDSLPGDQRIIVLDNGSRDQTVEIARQRGVEIIKNNNIGYGKAANIGLFMATTPYAVLLNPDVIITPADLSAMVECAKTDPEIGMVGARMYHREEGKKIYQREYAFDAEGRAYTHWMVGALMLFKMDALKKVGAFDENIFLFFEETDLCSRFVKAGYKLAICAHAEAEHESGTSCAKSMRVTKIRSWHSAWSRSYYYKKHYGLARSLHKSLNKLFKNSINIVRHGVLMRKTAVVINAYEIGGLLAFHLGLKAYKKSGKARIT